MDADPSTSWNRKERKDHKEAAANSERQFRLLTAKRKAIRNRL
jgi:hypothetical protein